MCFFPFRLSVLAGLVGGALISSAVASPHVIHMYDLNYPADAHLPVAPSLHAQFPQGITIGLGSGLMYAGTDAAGHPSFYSLTDRGPNGDSPSWQSEKSLTDTKIFLVPTFTPQIRKITLMGEQAQVGPAITIHDAVGPVGGLPLPSNHIGTTHEIALDSSLRPIPQAVDARGLDTEGIVSDGKDGFWVCDEYGPFILHLDKTGRIIQKLGPAADASDGKPETGGLPSILQYRQPNRGFESITRLPSGKIIAAIQSTLDVDGKTAKKAPLIRLVSYDPATGKTAMYAYPVDSDTFKKNGDVKLGDLTAINDHELYVIEQGKGAEKQPVHRIMRIDLHDATDLTGLTWKGKALEFAKSQKVLEKQGIRFVDRTLAVDLQTLNWPFDKAEGLALIDAQTLAVTNDNDFGVASQMRGAGNGAPNSTDPTDYSVNDQHQILWKGQPVSDAFRVEASSPKEAQSQLWVIGL
jgi:hypothetical protein